MKKYIFKNIAGKKKEKKEEQMKEIKRKKIESHQYQIIKHITKSNTPHRGKGDSPQDTGDVYYLTFALCFVVGNYCLHACHSNTNKRINK